MASFANDSGSDADFITKKSDDIPKFLKEAEEALAPEGELTVSIKDIEGCFPNMPKQAIKDGLKNILAEISKLGYEAVYVPKMNRDKCLWQSKSKAYTRIPFETLIDVMEFALENTLIKSLDGKIMKQTKGIPMGDPHSPGMCIGACAWMEKEWINKMGEKEKEFFRFARYMDDVITVYAKNKAFDHDKLLDSQQTECYTSPPKIRRRGG